MSYIENPKTKGSGILTAIPQTGVCPNGCADCFFQSGRSYLEPLDQNLPNMPTPDQIQSHVIRVNDGNDSNVKKDLVLSCTEGYPHKFYNTAIPNLEFPAPVVLTLNPGNMTDERFHRIDPIPANLMFVRFRTNLWNQELCRKAVEYYTLRDNPVPVVLTFMAYHETPKEQHGYVYRQRTLNSYWAITTEAWRSVMFTYRDNKWVYSCGKIEGERGDTHCARCGNCIREYFVTMERIRGK